ncbi:hypothetical protein [Propionicimonas paludicola]|uniref:hypothetical protein n=1 Tax=Propionicimonas paludicola TaxID=185243 RepID=UPI00117B494A|nr:hypothetical protein [Propionicimonas paludicola]
MTDNARPEDVAPHSEGDALSGLPEDSRVHLDDIEWPALDWSDTDEVPPPPPAPPVLRLVAPSTEPDGRPSATLAGSTQPTASAAPTPPGPTVNGGGTDWRPAVPFWLRTPEPETEPQPAGDDEPADWRPAVPFWLRMPESQPTPPTAGHDQVAQPAPADDDVAAPPALEAEPIAEHEDAASAATASAETSPTPPTDELPLVATPQAPVAAPAAVDDRDDELPDEDLTPLPGTTGEAVFFPPSSSRAAMIRPASAASPQPPTSPEAAEPTRPTATTTRPSLGAAPTAARTPAPGPFSVPGAPYAQYDSPDRDWDSLPRTSPWAGPDQPADQQRTSSPSRPARAPRPAAARRRWLLRGAVIASVIGALVVSLVVILAVQGRFNSVDGTLSGPPVGTPDTVVSGYLNALAHNDSQQALGFAKLRPADQRLLTDEVLAASNKVAPLRQVSVRTTELSDYRAQVEASYLIGGQRVTQSFTVYAVGAEWKLYDVARKVDLTLLKTGDLPLVINGASVPVGSVELFPGHYQVATTDDRYQFSDDSFVVSSPAAAPELGAVRLSLSSTGIEKILSAANTRLQDCLAAHELQPVGCGFGAVAPRGTKVQLDTVRWKVSKGPSTLKLLRPTLDPDDPRLATADVMIQVTVSAKDTKGGNLGVPDWITTVLADLSSDDVQITLN